jgi:hypothetical protein
LGWDIGWGWWVGVVVTVWVGLRAAFSVRLGGYAIKQVFVLILPCDAAVDCLVDRGIHLTSYSCYSRDPS